MGWKIQMAEIYKTMLWLAERDQRVVFIPLYAQTHEMDRQVIQDRQEEAFLYSQSFIRLWKLLQQDQ